ncbi:PREDICTED: 30S ribosomal protein 3, chloroplastic-like isoform X2 [Nelumbo nucifera]|uniref:30S ribosomal protein 3, chloroplastic n=1 Tax=Nelumbo nucifera TaxID=4432 RepID=A0A1U8Q3L8_NELNU|nr:PREDICTED: 30S ribosomal protein 3, chloroplastic-like isoform X2 [Nelumbo nucifera]
MLSMAIQPGVNGFALTRSSFPQKFGFNPVNASISFNPKPASLHLSPLVHLIRRPNRKQLRLSTSASAAEAIEEEATTEDSASTTPQESEPFEEKELGVVVKPMEKPRLVLKFVWMEKNIGLALDQKIPGHGTIPLSPYYFWPRKDAWEELKSLLESKPWISQKRMIILLNQATDIINLWQQSGGNLS